MPITDEIKKTLSDPTPLYALAGAGDLAYEKLREVPGRVEALAADRKGAQEKAAAKLQEAQVKVTDTVATLPADLKVLQEKAQSFALQQVGRAFELAVKAKEAYDELAERGKGVVERGREDGQDGQVEPVSDDRPGIVGAELVEEAPAEAADTAAPKRSTRTRKPAAE